jgi:hypothetical protein
MGRHLPAGPALDLFDGGSQPEVGHVRDGATALADDVVVVLRLARDVGVVAAGQVDALEDVKLGEKVQGPEDGGATDAQILGAGVGEQVVRREVPVARRHELGHGAAWLGEAVAGFVEGRHEWFG